MEKKVVILYRESEADSKGKWIRAAQRVWEMRGYETERMPVREELPWEHYSTSLQKEDVAWLVTLDMAGFAWSTLLEGSVYNLLRARQIFSQRITGSMTGCCKRNMPSICFSLRTMWRQSGKRKDGIRFCPIWNFCLEWRGLGKRLIGCLRLPGRSADQRPAVRKIVARRSR